MNMLEERLREGLAALADELPPSDDPLAEHHRRIARASRMRRPMLAAAAAAVVLAGVATPIVLTRGDSAQVATPPPSIPVPPSVELDLGPDDPYGSVVAEPVSLAAFTRDGREWIAWAYVSRAPAERGWEYLVCVTSAPNDSAQLPKATNCRPVFYPLPGQPQSKVETISVLGAGRPASGPLPGLLLFATVPEVSTLEVRVAGGDPVTVRRLARIPELSLFLADFGQSYEGFGYTARDGSGNVIESGIS